MNYKKLIFCGLILLILINMATVSAIDNDTYSINLSSDLEDDINLPINDIEIDETTLNYTNEGNYYTQNTDENEISEENSNNLISISNEENCLTDTQYIYCDVDFSIDDVISNYNEPIKIIGHIKFKTEDGSDLPNNNAGEMYAYINSTKTNVVTVFREGGQFNITSNNKYGAGYYRIDVYFKPNSFFQDYTRYRLTNYQYQYRYINITPIASLSLENDGLYHNYGEKGLINVKDIFDNTTLSGKKIKVTWYSSDGVYLDEEIYSTDKNGQCSFTINKNIGDYILNITLIDDYYSANSFSTNFNIIASEAKISMKRSVVSYSDQEFIVKVIDSNNIPLDNVKIKILAYKSSKKYDSIYGITDSNGEYEGYLGANVGSYKLIISVPNSNYKVSSITKNLKINKEKVKITAKKITGDTQSYTTLKAIVKDKRGDYVEEGTVKFTINGKSYKVKVKNGVATKKIKLSKAKTYKYKATFSSTNFITKSASSKAVIKKAYAYYTVKIGKYACKIPYKDYKKIKKAKKNGYFSKKYYTGKKTSYNFYTDKKVTYTKKLLFMDSWPTGYKTYVTKAPKGYTFYGTEAKKVGNHVKRYEVYKKTTYKKVLVKTPKTKVYIIISANNGRSTAQLYYTKYVYKEKDGGVTTEYYISKNKKIF